MKNLTIVLLALLLLTALAGPGAALVTRPPPPPVPQNIGLQDTSILTAVTTSTDQSACRLCHLTIGTIVPGGVGAYSNTTLGGVPTRHHSLLARKVINPNTSAIFACQDCHPSTPGVGMGILIDRSCADCHNGTNKFPGNAVGGHVGNITRPHHVNTSYASSKIGNPAANRTCDFCHGNVVDNYNDGHYKPAYNTSFDITPYASFKATNFTQPNGLGGNVTWGGCYSCHLADPNATPLPIGANEPNHHDSINSGSLIDISRAPSPGRICFVCHVIDPSNPRSPYRPANVANVYTGEIIPRVMELRNSTIEAMDAANNSFEPGTTNITINGTGCQKCHSVASLHNVQFQYVPGGNGQQGLGHINNNVDCFGCHNSWLPADSIAVGALVPTVTSISPSVVTADTLTTLTIAGNEFVNGVYTSVVKVDGVTYNPTSITDTQIVVDIPALATGTHTLQLLKGGDILSNLETLTAVPKVTLSSATLDGTTLTIVGEKLGTEPTNAEQNIIAGSAGYSASVVSWTDTKIVATVTSSVVVGNTASVITVNGGEAAVAILPALAPLKTPIPVGVDKPVLKTITISSSSAAVSKNGKQTFTATAKDQFGNPMSKVSIKWSSSSTNIGNVNPTTATTGTNGQVTTTFSSKTKAGKTIITAKSGSVSGTVTVAVK
jgi:hypothetical protein